MDRRDDSHRKARVSAWPLSHTSAGSGHDVKMIKSNSAAKPVQVGATYRLPRPILLAMDALGTTGFHPFGDACTMAVVTPYFEGADAFVRPVPFGVDDDDTALTTGPWATQPNAGEGVLVHQVVLHLRCDDVESLPRRTGSGPAKVDRLGDYLFSAIDEWFERLRSWIEVSTAQDLNWEHPRFHAEVEGGGLLVWLVDETGERGQKDRSLLTFHMNEERPAHLRAWLTAANLAGRQIGPPVSHRLMRDARAAYWRNQWRRMVLDASAACEIVMSEALLSGGFVDPTTHVNGMANLIAKCKKHAIGLGATAEDLDRLRVARNTAAHTHNVDGRMNPVDLLDTAQKVVESLVPLESFVAHQGLTRDYLLALRDDIS